LSSIPTVFREMAKFVHLFLQKFALFSPGFNHTRLLKISRSIARLGFPLMVRRARVFMIPASESLNCGRWRLRVERAAFRCLATFFAGPSAHACLRTQICYSLRCMIQRSKRRARLKSDSAPLRAEVRA
jgi:hypothetical protein